MSNMFYGCSSLKELNILNFATNNVINMKNMFNKCAKLEAIYLYFNTINVFDMTEMFCECGLLKNLNVSNFKIGDKTFVKNMFKKCSDDLKEKVRKENFKIKNRAFGENKN